MSRRDSYPQYHQSNVEMPSSLNQHMIDQYNAQQSQLPLNMLLNNHREPENMN